MYGFSTVALFAGIAAAVHAPVGNPSGNPITAPLNEIVPACKAFTIKWQPTTTNTVSILLLRGPSTNVVPIGAPIAQGIANSGSFSWTPSSDLEADTTHYGIQLIDDVTGQYQYSTQFGISKDASCKGSSSSSSAASVKATSAPTYGASSSKVVVVSSTSCNSTSSVAAPTKAVSSAYVASTGAPANSSVVLPTKSMSVPASLLTSATGGSAPTGGSQASASPSAPQHTGAAAKLGAGFGLVGAVAGMVFML